MKIAILSSASVLGFFDPDAPNAQMHNLQEKGASTSDLSHFALDYQDLTDALTRNGLDYQIVAWDDPSIDWKSFNAVLVHTPWDYYDEPNKFISTMEHIASQTPVFNSIDIIRWNMDKNYLGDLERAGIRIIQTQYVDTAATPDVLDVMPNANWDNGYIFKPTVSAGAADVYLIHSAQEAKRIYETRYRNNHPTLMIQPFMREIQEEGEWSFIFFDGEYSHGVLKKTVEGGFGVKHSVKNKEYIPTHDMIAQAKDMYKKIIQSRGDNPLYTRLDTIKRADGKLYVMELEQIEPYLYLHAHPEAATKLVKGLLARL